MSVSLPVVARSTSKPSTLIFPKGAIELQNHGNVLFFKKNYVEELP